MHDQGGAPHALLGTSRVSTPIENIEIDLRIGGVFRADMVNDDTGDVYPNSGVYTVIDPPSTLA